MLLLFKWLSQRLAPYYQTHHHLFHESLIEPAESSRELEAGGRLETGKDNDSNVRLEIGLLPDIDELEQKQKVFCVFLTLTLL